MLMLPGHIPVISVPHRRQAMAKRLMEKLQDALEELGIRFLVVGPEAQFQSSAELIALLANTDMLLVDCGVVDSPACLLSAEHEVMGRRADRMIFHCREASDAQSTAAAMQSWLGQCAAATPVTGAVLIGGKSSRMGRPKHLIEDDSGTTWLEYTLKTMASVTAAQVISGNGVIPDTLNNFERVEDLAGFEGPLAGIGALFSKRPFTSWLVAACDMPHLSKAALEWLLMQRHRDYFAVIPINPKTGRNEPLLAWYDYRCGPVVEELIRSGAQRASVLCRDERVLQPLIPDQLADSWRNINYFDEIERR